MNSLCVLSRYVWRRRSLPWRACVAYKSRWPGIRLSLGLISETGGYGNEWVFVEPAPPEKSLKRCFEYKWLEQFKDTPLGLFSLSLSSCVRLWFRFNGGLCDLITSKVRPGDYCTFEALLRQHTTTISVIGETREHINSNLSIGTWRRRRI